MKSLVIIVIKRPELQVKPSFFIYDSLHAGVPLFGYIFENASRLLEYENLFFVLGQSSRQAVLRALSTVP